MAENPFFNRVDERNGSVIMDISDTTATADDVLAGKKFYSASGAPATGTLVPGTITEVQANGTSVATSGIANIPAASTSGYGVTKLNNTTSSTSTDEAATAAVVKQLNDNLRLDRTTTRVRLKQLTWRPTGTLYYAMATVPSHIIATMGDFGSLPSGTIITMYDYDSTTVQFVASTNAFTDNSLIDVNVLAYGN